MTETLSSISPALPVPGASPDASTAGVSVPDAPVAKARTVTLSPKALEKAKMKRDRRGTPDAALRLGIRGSGCSGFSYVIEFHDGPPAERDHVFDYDGLTVLIDKKSMIYLAGSVLDWEQTLMQQGFKFRNPQEAAACGCGHSFTVK